ncbi:AsmA-like protein [Volucribacter psittacicida]|uniref:AsmA-like protein n=1 Tax=Volucribacter psittacicida TaxID=203482 RepID=A0A4R1FNX3_9PAST|nr:hypothetical protein [Volucribacter psittacicida]TCJ93958.1 AsmA-like protein [Volucribacter psittacicida]
MKKVIALLTAFVCVVITLFYFKVQHLKSDLVEALQHQQAIISSPKLSFQVFPLALVAENVKIQPPLLAPWQVDLPRLELQIDLFSLLQSQIKIEKIHLTNGKLSSSQHNASDPIENINLTLKPTALFLTELFSPTIKQENFALQGHFVYKNQPYKFHLPKARWLIKQPQVYQFYADELEINQATLEKVAIQYLPSRIYFRSQQGNIDFYRQQKGYALVGENVDIYAFWATLDIRSILTGKGKLTGFLQFENARLPTGELSFDIYQGNINGINLFNFVAQYFPINYDEQQLARQQINTDFDIGRADLVWDQQKLWVKNLVIQTSVLQLTGAGEVGLLNGQCDFQTQLTLNQQKYSTLRLPIHFFGDCHSPQYKIEMNKELRNNLKQRLKRYLR